jgi:hypothetical protein
MAFALRLSSFAMVVFALAAASIPARGADIVVFLDHASIVRMPEGIRMLVIGNPVIVDATLVAGGVAVLTGKSYGATNLIAYDRAGREAARHSIEVRDSDGNIGVVYRGTERRTYSCMPDCNPRNALGDDAKSDRNEPSNKSSPGGPCNSPDDIAADGSRCGDRAASERPGGRP